MSLTQNVVTITGNIGNDPVMSTTKTGTPVLNFRVGSSTGRWDHRSGAWADDGTSWFAVSVFGALAENARASLHCGDPVIITGRLRIREWENETRKGTSADITADAIGHDLNRGTSAFARRMRVSTETAPAPREDADADGAADTGPSQEELDAWGVHGMVAPDATTSSTDEAQPAFV